MGDTTPHGVAEKRVNLQYNALGQYTFINRFENLSATNPALRSVYTYDKANRLTELAHRHIISQSSSTLLARYQFSYDALNRITSINSNLDGVSNFTHDLRGQLTNATHASPRPAEQFNYDDNGNRTGGSYANGTNNQTTSDGIYTYTFDSEGNRARRTKVSDNSYEDYTWDHRNRLTSVTRKSQAGTVLATAAYVYDQFNRLIKRTVDTDGAGSGAAADQFFAGFEGINPTLIFDGANSGDLTNRLLWGDIVDELFADEQITNPTNAGNTLWAVSDHLGTIRDLVDFNGTAYTVANHRVYDSFGNLTSETNGSVSSLFGFTGKLFDKEFKLSNHWNRWYDPALGKWISEDPIGFAAGDANLGRYVGNASLTNIDIDGLDTRKVQGYTVTGKGHHIIRVELWTEFGFDQSVFPTLDTYRNLETPTHGNIGHGKNTGYTGFLRSELRERLSTLLANNGDMRLSVAEQQLFIKEFIDDVHAGNVKRPFISDFNTAAKGGKDSVKAWLEKERANYPRFADDVPGVRISGLRPLPPAAAEDIARRLGAPMQETRPIRSLFGKGAKKISKKIILFVAAWVAYNSARSNGLSHLEAATIAGLESANPLPIGYEEWNAAGSAYSRAMEWAMENNVNGPKGFPKLDRDGVPIHPRLLNDK